jgi:hypothetical protein
MRNRIAGMMHWEHVGIEHRQEPRKSDELRSARGTKLSGRTPNPYAALATATLIGVAVILTLSFFFGGPSARA